MLSIDVSRFALYLIDSTRFYTNPGMNRLFLFFKQIYVPLLFIILEVVAINYYAQSTSYTRAKILSSTNSFMGNVYTTFSDVKHYFSLKKENDSLVNELVELHNEFEKYKAANPQPEETLELPESEAAKYYYTTANVINNTIAFRENFLTLDKGILDGIEANMAVITPEGTMVGIVQTCSEKYSVCMSVLNEKFRTAGRIKGSDHFGSIFWNGAKEDIVQLTEVSKYADISVGDTIVTDYSSIFPSGIVIGTVQSWEMVADSYFDLEVKLTTPLTSVHKVLLVRYADQVEQMMLEAEALNEEDNK